MWGWILKAAIALGLDRWAKRKAVELAQKLKDRAKKRAGALLDVVGEKVVTDSRVILVREDRDIHRPGAVVTRDDKPYRIVKLLMVNRLGAFYEAQAE